MKKTEAARMIGVDDICISPSRRGINVATVSQLASSMEAIGLQHPITVRFVKNFHDAEYGVVDSAVLLVAGGHRLEAARRLGWATIACSVVEMDEREARMWEIAENLHRSDLTELERSEQIAEWIGLASKVAQSEPVIGGRGHEGGLRMASRELGIDRADAQRAARVASLSDEAKEAARETGLDDNRSAMLKASARTHDEQAAIIREIDKQKKAPRPPKVADDPLTNELAAEKQVARLMDAWNAAGSEARQEFLNRIDEPIMDRRFGGAAA
jgi:ParB-like chromosome segregation protein Spo0J